MTEKAEPYITSYATFIKTDESIYGPLLRSNYHAYLGQNEQAIAAIEEFTAERDFQYWVLLFMDEDPVYDSIKKSERFQKALKKMEVNFWGHHQEIKETLREKGCSKFILPHSSYFRPSH